jgi:predicted RNase H-like nuclease (RuvC/YqgF family)
MHTKEHKMNLETAVSSLDRTFDKGVLLSRELTQLNLKIEALNLQLESNEKTKSQLILTIKTLLSEPIKTEIL